MKRELVKSSRIKSIGYEPSNFIMEIEFNRGGIYQYSPVSYSTYKELINSESVGKAFEEFKKRTDIKTEKVA